MATAHEIIPFSLKDAPSLIEKVLPVQRLSIDVYKERMAGSGQTLTALGSYWKGRKPLVLNRACILGALLPASDDSKKDLEIFELLMGMDDVSMRQRLQLTDSDPFPNLTYRDLANKAKRAEEIQDSVHKHVWNKVNEHLRTSASSTQELVYQLGVMRFGARPWVGDVFSGSGQIPFEAARLGCNTYASDLNPIACMLTWSAFNIVGASEEDRRKLVSEQKKLVSSVREDIDKLELETDGKGWRAKNYLYCLEVKCPTSGWMVPVLQTRVISQPKKAIAKLVPDPKNKRYRIEVLVNVNDDELRLAEKGTISRTSRFSEAIIVHSVDGVEHRNTISSIRHDLNNTVDLNGIPVNDLRPWKSTDFEYLNSDLLNERLYAIHWIRDDGSNRPVSEFRGVTEDDLIREQKASDFVKLNFDEWQKDGLIPNFKIEPGSAPRYEGRSLIVTRGWTYWQHLFNPRQLLVLALIKKRVTSRLVPSFAYSLNYSSKLCIWDKSGDKGQNVFYNQALSALYTYCCRSSAMLLPFFEENFQRHSLPSEITIKIENIAASSLTNKLDVIVTDPPYGDAVRYEEIFDFFIAWLHRNPPSEFSDWVWDSRRALAIKGEDHDFKLSMVAAYKRMTDCMADNGIQIIMFTHQSGSIWADMANIVWASGLRVTAAWYVVTETDSALRDGQYVKGTILLVLRKRLKALDTARDELAYELAEEVKTQVDLLTGLNKDVKDLYRDENLFEDADLQMAGYAAALRVLTRYSTIDGVSMPQEAMRPRVKGQTTMVDELIAFAVNIANEYLVPDGVDREVWEKSSGIERFYLKMLDMESKGIHVLSNYQNFAKAFKVQDYGTVMDEVKANHANLKSAAQLGKRGMTASEEFGPTVLRSVLYAVHLLQENKMKPEDVMHQLRDLVPDYFRERDRLTALADYVSKKTGKARPDESSNAMVLRDLVRRERV